MVHNVGAHLCPAEQCHMRPVKRAATMHSRQVCSKCAPHTCCDVEPCHTGIQKKEACSGSATRNGDTSIASINALHSHLKWVEREHTSESWKQPQSQALEKRMHMSPASDEQTGCSPQMLPHNSDGFMKVQGCPFQDKKTHRMKQQNPVDLFLEA